MNGKILLDLKYQMTYHLMFLGGIMEKFILLKKQSEKENDMSIFFMIKKNGKKHFCLISSISRLLRKEKQKKTNLRYYFDNCLNSRQNKEALEKHKEFCESFEPCNQLPPFYAIQKL